MYEARQMVPVLLEVSIQGGSKAQINIVKKCGDGFSGMSFNKGDGSRYQ